MKALRCVGDQWSQEMNCELVFLIKGRCTHRAITDIGPDCTGPFKLCLKILNFRARRCQNDFKLEDHSASTRIFFFKFGCVRS